MSVKARKQDLRFKKKEKLFLFIYSYEAIHLVIFAKMKKLRQKNLD